MNGVRVASFLVMTLPIKLLGLAGIIGATAAAAIAIDRKRRQLTAGNAQDVPLGRTRAPDVVIVDAEIVGLADVLGRLP